MSIALAELPVMFIDRNESEDSQTVYLSLAGEAEENDRLCELLQSESGAARARHTPTGGTPNGVMIEEHEVGLFRTATKTASRAGLRVVLYGAKRNCADFLPEPSCVALGMMAILNGVGGMKGSALDMSIHAGIEAAGGAKGIVERLNAQPEVKSAVHRENSFMFRHLFEIEPVERLPIFGGNFDASFIVRAGIWPYYRMS